MGMSDQVRRLLLNSHSHQASRNEDSHCALDDNLFAHLQRHLIVTSAEVKSGFGALRVAAGGQCESFVTGRDR